MDDMASFALDAAQITTREAVLPDDDSKAALCVGALVSGCPNAFVDFHRLATAGDGFGDDAMTAETAFALRIDTSAPKYVQPEEMPTEYARFVRDVLVDAEVGDDPAGVSVQHAGNTLAKFFHEKGDHEKACYFINKDLNRAVAVGDRKKEVTQRRRLALEREAQGEFTASAAAFEIAAEICERHANDDIIGVAGDADTENDGDGENENTTSVPFSFARTAQTSNADVARVLYKAASSCVGRGDLAGSENNLEKCLLACGNAGPACDHVLEAATFHELGLARGKQKDWTRAIDLQTAYLRACEIVGDERGEGVARVARADARWESGDAVGAENDLRAMLAPEGAERHGRMLSRSRERLMRLEARLSVSNDQQKIQEDDAFTEDEIQTLTAEARGWCTLGRMRSARGAVCDAADAHEKFHELARVCGDKALEREARVCLGLARGAARVEQLMTAVVERSRAPSERLMAWKSDGRSFFQA